MAMNTTGAAMDRALAAEINRGAEGVVITERPLACPLTKSKACRYSRCRTYRLRSNADIRTHLGRYHLQLPFCPTCKNTFKNHAARDTHAKKTSCARSDAPDPPGVTQDQLRSIDAVHNRDKQQEWYAMFDILCPGVPHPASMYHEHSIFSEVLGDAFYEFKIKSLNEVVERALATYEVRNGPSSPEARNLISLGAEFTIHFISQAYRVPEAFGDAQQPEQHQPASHVPMNGNPGPWGHAGAFTYTATNTHQWTPPDAAAQGDMPYVPNMNLRADNSDLYGQHQEPFDYPEYYDDEA